MPTSNAPVGLVAFVGFGSDTDCDGTSFYCCGVFARSINHAHEVMAEEFSGMTWDGINEIVPGSEARKKGIDVDSLMARTSTAWDNEGNVVGTTPFRYESTGASWNPWVYDDSIGIPALDSRYDD